jgi:hypothetical protein
VLPADAPRLRARVRELYARAEPWLAYLGQYRLRTLGRVGASPPPATFRAKVLHKMAFDRRPLLTTFADKVAARRYVEATLGPGFLPELHLATDRADDVRLDALPREFVLKPTHGSGATLVVWSGADPGSGLPGPRWRRALVRPEQLDEPALRRLCAAWLGLRYRPAEWAYRKIPPGILVEELLLDGGGVPADQRVYVFNGRARLVHLDLGRFARHSQVFYTPGWERIEAREGRFPRAEEIPRPPHLAAMLAAAEELARPTDLLRVDFYAPGGRLVVGELTNYPFGGGPSFQPEAMDRLIGSWWTLPRRYTQAEVDRLAAGSGRE